MKQALAITGMAAAATLTLGGLLVAMPEPAMAAKHNRHVKLPGTTKSQLSVRNAGAMLTREIGSSTCAGSTQ